MKTQIIYPKFTAFLMLLIISALFPCSLVANTFTENHTPKNLENTQSEKHQFGFNIHENRVSDITSYWTYLSLYYFRLTHFGNYGARINYANKFSETALQYELETYPVITKKIYGTAIFSKSNHNQIHYPTFKYYIEPYFLIGNGIELSVGNSTQYYGQFSKQKIRKYTSSIGLYAGNWYFWARPSYHEPIRQTHFQISARRYFGKYSYVSINANTGRLPDIGDLPPNDQIINIKQTGISLDGKASLTEHLYIKGSAGYTEQTFIKAKKLRRIGDALIELTWQY